MGGINTEELADPRSAEPSPDRRAFWRACLVGGGLASLVFLLILVHGHATLLRQEQLGDFYDIQAHALLSGHWDVPAASLGIEGFRIGSKTYEYFGPWPAILRLPVAAVTHQLDGRLSQLSMLLAFVVAMVAVARLTWLVRVMARGDTAVGRGERVAAGGFMFLVGAGSVLLFLSSHLVVFHEAEIWGVALALAAFEWVIRYAQTQRGSHLVLAAILSTLAILSRVSVGMGPLIALGLVLLAGLARKTRELAGLAPEWATARNALRIFVAVLIPLALYAYVNHVKFGTLFSVPFDRQLVTFTSPMHRAMLDANHNSMIGPQFVPTVLGQYLRPDAIRLDPLFPWVTFPPPAHIFGGVTFDELDVASSVPSSMPALTILGIIGVIALVRPRRAERPSFAALRLPVLGALIALAPALAFGFITQRYLADVLPVLVLTALAGLYVLLAWSRSHSRAAARWAWGGLALLVVISVWWNAGLAVLYQREFGYPIPSQDIAAFVDFQYAVHDAFPGGSPPHVVHGTNLPVVPLKRGTLFVVKDCAALYWSSGSFWQPFDRDNAGGHYRLRVDFPKLPAGTVAPLITLGSPGASVVLASRTLPDGRVVLELLTDGAPPHAPIVGAPFPVTPGQPTTLDVVLDHQLGEILALDESALAIGVGRGEGKALLARARPVDQVAIGRNPGRVPTLARFPGEVRSLPVTAALCRRIVSSSR